MSTSSVAVLRRPRSLPRRLLAITVGLTLALMALVGAPRVAHAQAKIAVIDLRRAVADTEDGLRVQAKLQQLFDNRQTEYDAKEKAYGEAKDELEKLAKKGKAPEDELRKKYAALEKMAVDLRTTQYNYRTEMQRQENEMMYPIIKQMLTLVRRLSAQNGYEMVLNKEAVPYFRSDLDITDRIIQMYNASQGVQPPSKKGATGKGKKGGDAPKDKAPAPKK
jgi:outer membrane protein